MIYDDCDAAVKFLRQRDIIGFVNVFLLSAKIQSCDFSRKQFNRSVHNKTFKRRFIDGGSIKNALSSSDDKKEESFTKYNKK